MEASREVIREIDYYNLDAIISVGYRVNFKRGTQFRQWALQQKNPLRILQTFHHPGLEISTNFCWKC
jgi:hypothetical protein